MRNRSIDLVSIDADAAILERLDASQAGAAGTESLARARLTSQVQFLAPRLKGQVIDDPEPGPFRWA
jgi:hypothetical protein